MYVCMYACTCMYVCMYVWPSSNVQIPNVLLFILLVEKWLHERKELLFGSVVYKGKVISTTSNKKCDFYVIIIKLILQ